MEKNRKENHSLSFDQTGDKYFEYLKEMKNDQSDESEFSASFMTF